ncbi:MAG: molybdopterin-binding protein [Deltaproteobacteria bacterium]|nr:molybdopterin-binding protein [Deltaproteobacteria bacterium]
MIKLSIEEAVGKPIAHDITRIVPGESKGPAFKKGHVVTEDDLPLLRDMGKNHVYVLDPEVGYIHEDDAAEILAKAFQEEHFRLEGPSEGKFTIRAAIKGLLKINLELLAFINRSKSIICSTMHRNTVCFQGSAVAATRIIPVALQESEFWPIVDEIRDKGPLLSLLPFTKVHIGVIVTGQEVFSGRVKDSSLEILSPKVRQLDGTIIFHRVCPDDKEIMAKAIQEAAGEGCEVILVTGGLSVDPDDVTLDGIIASGANLVSYGSPILPGAMFAVAYLGDVAVLGVPAAVFYYKVTVLDIFLPRAMSGDVITREDIVSLGHGGLCLVCKECRYPICPFGKGA